RGSVLFRTDALLGHLGARRVGRGSDLEQSGNGLRRPDNIELLEGFGKIVARQGCDPSAEDAGQGRACPVGLFGAEGMAGDTSTEDFRAAVAGIGKQWIPGHFEQKWIDGLTGLCVPAADNVIGATSQQGAAVRQERNRPDRQSRTDQSARQRVCVAVDNSNRAADPCGRYQRPVRRDRNRDHRPWSSADFTSRLAVAGQEIESAVGATGRDLAIVADGNGVEWARHCDNGCRRASERPDAHALVVADTDQCVTIGSERQAIDVLYMPVEYARRSARERPQPYGVVRRRRSQ